MLDLKYTPWLFSVAFFACSDADVRLAGESMPVEHALPAGVDPVVRGQYLVDAVTACADCHTPRDQNCSRRGTLRTAPWPGV